MAPRIWRAFHENELWVDSMRASRGLKGLGKQVQVLLSSGQSSAAVGLRWWMLALLVFVLDQLAKWIVQLAMPYGQVIPLLEFFNLVHVWNTGGAFSVLADAGGWQRYGFIGLALAVSVWLAIALCKPLPRADAAAFSLILGGALGNVMDRIVRGHVVDYLDIHWRDWHWPAFNLADIGISCGAALLLAAALRGNRTEKLA